MATPQELIESSFTDPATEPVSSGPPSVLHLLRRDLRHCVTNRQVLWPATHEGYYQVSIQALHDKFESAGEGTVPASAPMPTFRPGSAACSHPTVRSSWARSWSGRGCDSRLGQSLCQRLGKPPATIWA